MDLLSNGNSGFEHNEPALTPQIQVSPQSWSAIPNLAEEGASFESFRPGRLLRKYWLLIGLLLIVGCTAGVLSVVLSSPKYKANLLLEVHFGNSALPGNSGESPDVMQTDIQTQVNKLETPTFLKRGADRMQAETVSFAPTGRDIFSRLRQRIHPATLEPLEAQRIGTGVAIASFHAQPVINTRLIELTCESTSPDIAAQFLNSMAEEFVDDASSSRMNTAQRTAEWLAGQIEETKAKMQDAEQRLSNYVQASGNIFAGQNATLNDTKLAELKGDLAKIQEQRILRQTRYELTLKNPPGSLAEVLEDPTLRAYKTQIENLQQQRAALTTTYTAKYDKVRRIDAQIATLQKAYDAQVTSTVRRIKSDYEASLSQEKRLRDAYTSQAQMVSSEAGKATEYASLKRDLELQRNLYQGLLVQENQANMSSSVPISPISIVEPSIPPAVPYTPRPVLNISFGAMFSLMLAGGIIFLKERMDTSIKTPGASRILFNAPELGVIPNLEEAPLPKVNGNGHASIAGGGDSNPATALLRWQSGPAFVKESFRGTLASILRIHASGKRQKTILITSPGPAEGKTTVVQNLGIALAEVGRKVLIIDADFRRPHLHRKFGLANDWGLIDLLCEDRDLSEYPLERLAVFTGLPGLWVLPNRVSSNNVSQALYSPRLRRLLEMLMRHYDTILVDAPPVLSVADTRIIAPLLDALILVLRAGVTNRDSAVEAYQKIQEDGLTLLGTVLTDYDLGSDRRRRYYYDYGDPSRA